MVIHCYITDIERKLLIDFLRSQAGVYILGFLPGDPEGLDDEAIQYNSVRFISLWPPEEVATQFIDSNSGVVETYSTVRSPLIEWQVPFQKRDLIIAGRFELEEFSTMVPGGPYRKEFLEARKFFNKIRDFLEGNFIKVNDGLFNGPEAVALFDKGYRDAPFDPDKTTWETIIVD